MIPPLSGGGLLHAQVKPHSATDQIQKKLAQEKEARFQARLSHVIAHENAHSAAAGRFGGAPVIISDRESGHVSGYVPIKMDFGKTADEAMANARTIAGAALAPGDPSGQDKAVAAAAMSIGGNLAAQRKTQQKEKQKELPAPAIGAPFQPKNVDTSQNPFASKTKSQAVPFQF